MLKNEEKMNTNTKFQAVLMMGLFPFCQSFGQHAQQIVKVTNLEGENGMLDTDRPHKSTNSIENRF